ALRRSAPFVQEALEGRVLLPVGAFLPVMHGQTLDGAAITLGATTAGRSQVIIGIQGSVSRVSRDDAAAARHGRLTRCVTRSRCGVGVTQFARFNGSVCCRTWYRTTGLPCRRRTHE